MFSTFDFPYFLLAHILLLFNGTASSPIPTKNKTPINETGIVFSRCIQNGTIAITFDDGPAPGPTETMIRLLDSKNIATTFFVTGNGLHKGSERTTLKTTSTSGHEIGHHTWSHPNLTTLNDSSIYFEMNRLTNELVELTGKAPTVMRPPYGEYNDQVLRIVNGELGFKVIMWSIDTNDWRHVGNTTAGLAEYVKKLNGTDPALTPGFIALHHDPYGGSIELAEACIDYGRKVGYRFVSLKECLGF